MSFDNQRNLISWHDNSSNEEGFRAMIILFHGDVVPRETIEVRANETTAALSPELATFPRRAIRISVTAFNEHGESEPATFEADFPVDEVTVPEISAEWNGAELRWEPVDGAARYLIGGSVDVIRIHGSGSFCLAPTVSDTRTLTLDAGVEPPIARYTLPLENPAPDRWFVYQANVSVIAVAPDGRAIANSAPNHVAETRCSTDIGLPASGSNGMPRVMGSSAIVVGALGTLFAASGLCLQRRRLWG